jgi:hypothetical protein
MSVAETKAKMIALVDEHGAVYEDEFELKFGIPCNKDFLRALREMIESGEFTNNPPPEHLRRKIAWNGKVERATLP